MIVAPLVGAWIEIAIIPSEFISMAVAPLVGAWIEIAWYSLPFPYHSSLPSWERGLKYHLVLQFTPQPIPSLPSWERGLKYVGCVITDKDGEGRSPRGSVD